MLKKSSQLAFIALLATGLAAPAWAQTATDGAIGGTIEDQSGAVVPRASITVHLNATNAEQKVVADDSGFFRVIHLTPGSYKVTVDATGFQQYLANEVTVQVGVLTDLHARLGVTGATDVVEVSSQAPAINTTSNDFAQVINLVSLEDLPVANYRWSSYALLTPGVVVECPIFCAVGRVSVAQLFLSPDSRRLGCGEVGSA